nr:MAG TPA: hypothetical protein [Caudoviricetes sp.]DAZ50466.1 MAG TPA: hypothetical protein [Caudoviricetes sp.]
MSEVCLPKKNHLIQPPWRNPRWYFYAHFPRR